MVPSPGWSCLLLLSVLLPISFASPIPTSDAPLNATAETAEIALADSACNETREVDAYDTQKVSVPTEMEVEETCANPLTGFKCTVKKTGVKVEYRKVLIKKPQVVKVCCDGYYQTKENTCKPLEHAAMAATQSKTGLLLAFLLPIGLLIIAVPLILYYRRKYHKEVDPLEPIVTYSSKPNENGQEYENKMYDPVNEPPAYTRYTEDRPEELAEEDEDEAAIEAKKLGTNHSSERVMNDYESLDAISGPSTSRGTRGRANESETHRLLDGKENGEEDSSDGYMVPLKGMNSPQQREKENNDNEKRHENDYSDGPAR